MGGPCQKGAPVEGKSQKHLWPPGESFGERIDGHGKERQHAQSNGRPVKGQQDAKRQKRLDAEPDKGLARCDLTCGDGTRPGAFDLSVKVTVIDVVPCASGPPHE